MNNLPMTETNLSLKLTKTFQEKIIKEPTIKIFADTSLDK